MIKLTVRLTRLMPIAHLLLLLSCSVLLCSSCTALSKRLNGIGRYLAPMASPMRGADHVEHTMTKTAAALAGLRIRPITTTTGKRSLCLADCRSLALGRNLELSAAQLDEFSKIALRESARKKMLPTIAAQGELSERDNYRWGFSESDGVEGRRSPPRGAGALRGLSGSTGIYSYGHERTSLTGKLELRWNLTDAALAFYMTRTGANDTLKAHYTRVRVAQDLLAKVDGAFFRLLGLQEAVPLARRLVAVRNDVERQMRTLVNRQFKDMTDYHRVREKAIRATQDLAALKAEIARQRNILATSMGLSPDYCVDGGFYVVGHLSEPVYCQDLGPMEMIALKNRPEAFMAGLDNLSSVNEYKKTIVKYFPKLTGFWRWSWDKDRYILEKDWKEIGVMAQFDLVEWLANNDDRRSASAQIAKTDRELANIALVIASQVRTNAVKYYEALEAARNSSRFLENSRRLLEYSETRAEKGKLDELALAEVRGDVLHERVRRLRSLGEARATLAELEGAMGTNYGEQPPCR